MRARLLVTAMALGTTVLAGGAVAQAAPSQAVAASTTQAVPGYWKYDGTYSESTCRSLAASYVGPAYCTPAGGNNRYALYIWVE
ncbi:hypothetical protein [Streptomyces ficellus]|uniref:Uncharacterized protein n=1 Tax=Streptomyces ficellus TaxID=1977088 RepID=A0A6I6FSH8_9ACTN|nr:hypothetical protein [Streptomyces ficellus]QGV79866.1 hypothetical protein EIZ62_17720 [Streptomyces ficellus]